MLRLFVAWVPAAPTRAALGAEVARLVRAAPTSRGVAEDALHVTLAFLGPTDEARLPALTASLADVAKAVAPFELTFEGLGAFPTRRRPRVLWAGVAPGVGAAAMSALAARVATACRDAGCPPDARDAFHPHLTLARVGRSDAPGAVPEPALEKLLTRGCLQRTYIPEVLSDLLLMVSEADVARSGPPSGRRHGSRYRVLARWPLGGGSSATEGGARAR